MPQASLEASARALALLAAPAPTAPRRVSLLEQVNSSQLQAAVESAGREAELAAAEAEKEANETVDEAHIYRYRVLISSI